MKNRIITIMIALCLLGSFNAQAGFWKSLANGLKDLAGAAGSAVLYESCVASGYTEEQSREMINNTYTALGLNTDNADLGISYVEADNKYERQNLVKDIAFDVVSESSNNPSLVEKFRIMTDAQLTYLGDMKEATSEEEKSVIFDNRTRAYADMFYDTYQEAKKRKAAYLSEKLRIKEQLLKQGYTDSNLALEVAGNILAVQKSDIPEQEKTAILKSYGFNEDVDELQKISTEVIAMDDAALAKVQEEERCDSISREKEEQEKLEREKQAQLLEKKDAIKSISNLVVPVFAFDQTDLTESQKKVLINVAQILNKYDDLTLKVVGHTCKIGYKSINLKKGMKRAESVKAYMVECGIPANRIFVDSKGEADPKSNVNSENRRVELFISEN